VARDVAQESGQRSREGFAALLEPDDRKAVQGMITLDDLVSHPAQGSSDVVTG
jgi:hypothetical protein